MTPELWVAARRKGVLPSVKTPEDYMEGLMRGMKDAAVWLLTRHPLAPSLETARAVHRRAMGNVVPFAGVPTKVSLVTRGFPSCDPSAIEPEFGLLEEQFRDGLPGNANAQEACRWVAFAAARWLRIHPFLDGNKRTISLWATTWLEARFGPLGHDRPIHHRLSSAYEHLRKGDLAPFGSLLLCLAGDASQVSKPEAKLWVCPHRVAPNFGDPPPAALAPKPIFPPRPVPAGRWELSDF